MRNWLIKLLGGYTAEEMMAEQKSHLRTVLEQTERLDHLARRFGITI